MTSETPKTLDILCKLSENTRLNKRQHFCAAERKNFYNDIFGSTAVVINIILGSVLFVTISDTLPNEAKWLSGFMAIIAGTCAGIQTFFNFQKAAEGHRKIANRYLEIQRESEIILANYEDGLIKLDTLQEEIRTLNEKYHKINEDAQDFPTTNRDYKKAKNRMKNMKVLTTN
ncbi:SLATT domain-containing protein [Scytonema sp. UIC 10036]|uniref:SLATT domain-containing protein n=1 Tax=Scytonema sp. UIC 10036 TaxID=2304196 RepID=UPI0012DA3697|nr:SLATT domain-containing protein [Scytonema sp. UIC 10036]MUG92804.1 SLATT domain-containing protein [Scytonema sp. UIC 10036]